jgi:hypothetical protein
MNPLLISNHERSHIYQYTSQPILINFFCRKFSSNLENISIFSSHVYSYTFKQKNKKIYIFWRNLVPLSGRGGSTGTGARLTRRGPVGSRVDRPPVPGRPGRLCWSPGRPATRAGSPGPPLCWSLWRPRFLITVINANDRISWSNGQPRSNLGQPGPSPRKTH